MKLHRAIKYLVIVLAIAAEIIEQQVVQRLLIAYGKNPADTFWDDIAIGATFGIVLFVILAVSDKSREHERRQARMIAEMNHHIRNALQVIHYGLTENSLLPREYIREAVGRIEWALREVLPTQNPKPQTQDFQRGRNRGSRGDGRLGKLVSW